MNFSSVGFMVVDDIERAVRNLKASYTEYEPRLLISERMYQRIRWLAHLGEAFPSLPRKLRKCHMRKRYQRMKQERERYR